MLRALPKLVADTPAPLGPVSPILKWAGGKGQMLDRLTSVIPVRYGKYVEPFFGGGALFFALCPSQAVIADSNPELINLYLAVRDDVEGVIAAAQQWKTDEETFYRVRSLDPSALENTVAAARTLYLNRTCFNGLYRVNRRGEFNVPFGRYKNPRVVDEKNLRRASGALSQAAIVCADYRDVLRAHARPGDFVFLDPPYIPISKYADFKRYTKEQFREADHRDLAEEVRRLQRVGCTSILTNSNHELVHELYAGFDIEVTKTRRNINCDGARRTGEDVIISIPPRTRVSVASSSLGDQVSKYPSTRYMGSKEKLLKDIWAVAAELRGDRVLDLFSGSGAVAYMFKAQGKSVVANDYMAFPAVFAKAMIENSTKTLSECDLDFLTHGKAHDRFVRENFAGLYFSDADNLFIDLVRSRIRELDDSSKVHLAKAALIRACMKKRARGIFTYVGVRYDDGRKDMRLTLRQHFKEAVVAINDAVFSNGHEHRTLNCSALDVDVPADIVYIDPPYFSPLSDNDYVRRYHFVEGIARDWEGVEIQQHTKTRKFKTYGSPFSTRYGAVDAFRAIFRRYADSSIIVSYSSNSLPDRDTMIALLGEVKREVVVVPLDHTYSFGNHGHKIGNENNRVSEYLFVAP